MKSSHGWKLILSKINLAPGSLTSVFFPAPFPAAQLYHGDATAAAQSQRSKQETLEVQEQQTFSTALFYLDILYSFSMLPAGSEEETEFAGQICQSQEVSTWKLHTQHLTLEKLDQIDSKSIENCQPCEEHCSE